MIVRDRGALCLLLDAEPEGSNPATAEQPPPQRACPLTGYQAAIELGGDGGAFCLCLLLSASPSLRCLRRRLMFCQWRRGEGDELEGSCPPTGPGDRRSGGARDAARPQPRSESGEPMRPTRRADREARPPGRCRTPEGGRGRLACPTPRL